MHNSVENTLPEEDRKAENLVNLQSAEQIALSW